MFRDRSPKSHALLRYHRRSDDRNDATLVPCTISLTTKIFSILWEFTISQHLTHHSYSKMSSFQDQPGSMPSRWSKIISCILGKVAKHGHWEKRSFLYLHLCLIYVRDPDQYKFRIAELPSDLLRSPHSMIQLENAMPGDPIKSRPRQSHALFWVHI